MTTSINGTEHKVVTLTRMVDAPRVRAFEAWVEPKHIVHWFYASEGWTTPFAETDVRPGGAYRIGFASPDGKNDFVFEGVYDEIAPPDRLVFTIGDGRPISVTFADADGKTRVALDLALETTHSEEQQREGWGAMLDHLADYLASSRPANRPKENTMQLNPYLTFDGRCEAAFEFYAKCLGGEIVAMIPHEGTPAADHVPSEWRNKIMHARLVVGDKVLMGSDAPPDRFEKPQGFSVTLGVDKPADAERIFQALAEGGAVQMPIQETFWAFRFGMLVDQFGIPWMVNCEKPI